MTRALAILLAVSISVTAIPAIITNEPVAEVASAQSADIVKVGWMQDFQNWNPLKIEMVSDWVACYLIYSSLFQYDEDWGEIENHLATDYYQVEWPSGNMSTFINISENAYFRNAQDPEDTSHPLTAFDVEYTIELILANPGNSWDYYVMNITGVNVTDDEAPWDYDRTDSPYQVRIDTAYPKATLIDDLVWIPILPEYWWSGIDDNSAKVLGNMKPSDLIGSGPFYFSGMDLSQWYEFLTAPNYHCEADYGEERDIDIGGIQYQIFTATSALAMAINQGQVDVIDITGAQQSTWDYVGGGTATVPVVKQVTSELGIYDIAINAIPEEFRTNTYATGNKILLDPIVRKAIGMTLHREDIIDTYFFGLPEPADTVLNPGFWHANLSDYTEVLPYNPAWAMENLTDAGYEDTDSDDYLEVTESSLAYINGWADVGEELAFDLHVPDSDPGYAIVGEAWVGYAAEAGIKFNYAQLSEGVMVSKEWYQAQFDLWVWSWYWGPEPLSNLACWKTDQMRVGGYNCVGPIGDWWFVDEENLVARSEFDEMFEQAMRTPDVNERKVLVDELQVMIYDEYVEFPPIYPNGLYAWTTAHFTGWGTWEDNVARTIISDMLWLWYDIEPVGGNALPEFNTPLSPSYEVEVGEPVTFSVAVSDPDGDPIMVNWSFGDGSHNLFENLTGDTTVEQTVTAEHTYTEAAEGLMLRVGLSDGQHTFEASSIAEVNVVLEINLGPDLVDIDYSPSIAYIDEETTWSASASDHEQGPEGAGLLFTWDWDDGTYDTELVQPVDNDTVVVNEQTHTWSEPGTYYVTVSVWDGFDDEENEQHNVTGTVEYMVVVNAPPSIPQIANISGVEGVSIPCVAMTSDDDPDTLTITWEWDDGTYDVETVDVSSSPGVPVISETEHTWDSAGTYSVTVYVDDGEGHNVSATADAEILASDADAPPGSIYLEQVPYPGSVDEEVALTVSAYDANGDELTVTIDFGDDDEAVDTIPGGSTDLQYVDFLHTYAAADVYDVTVYVDDGTANVSTVFQVVIVENEPPVITLSSGYSFYYNQTKEITPLECYDPDGDTLSVWYDWGDGTDFTAGDPDNDYAASHKYTEVGEFVLTVYADDGKGYNVSAEADVNVQEANRKPKVQNIVKDPVKTAYQPGDNIYFNVTVYDNEGDQVTVTISYGDDSDDDTTQVDLEPKTNHTVSFSHVFEEGSATPYTVVVVVKDNLDHYNMTWNSMSTTVAVEKESDGISTAMLAGIGLAVILVIVAVLLLLKRKKKGEPATVMGGMEGMAPSEAEEQPTPPEPPPAPPPVG